MLKIAAYLPKQRQTVLFSATMPPGLRNVMGTAMRPNYATVDCINDGDAATATNAQVGGLMSQRVCVCWLIVLNGAPSSRK